MSDGRKLTDHFESKGVSIGDMLESTNITSHAWFRRLNRMELCWMVLDTTKKPLGTTKQPHEHSIRTIEPHASVKPKLNMISKG